MLSAPQRNLQMNRRSLLKNSLAAGAVSLLPFPVLAASNLKPGQGFKQFMLGNLELTVLSDGYIRQSPVYPFMAPLASAEAVKALLEENFRPTDYVEIGMNVMVVRSKERVVLLDSGTGVFATEVQGRVLNSLADIGLKPSDITDIILSHAHLDHLGGLVDKQGKLTYGGADIYIAKAEYDFWQKATLDDFKNSPVFKMADFVREVIKNIQGVFKSIQPKLKFIDLQNGLHSIFSFQLAPGHTPGLTMTTISSKNEKLIYIADLIHSDVLLFPHPEWGFVGDTDIQQAITSRINMLQQLATDRTKTFAYHLPYPGLGHVRKKDKAFEWVPEVYATP